MKKKSEKYRLVNAVMNINQIIIRDANMSSIVDEFAEKFARMTITSLIDFFSEYDQIALNEKSRNLTAFMTSLELLRQITLSQRATNFVAQFVKVVIKVLKNHIPTKCRPFVNDIGVKEPENKGLVEEMANRYKIKRVIVSVYHSQANDMIEREHTSIVDALSKLSKEDNRE